MMFDFHKVGWGWPKKFIGEMEAYTYLTDKVIAYSKSPKMIALYLPPFLISIRW